MKFYNYLNEKDDFREYIGIYPGRFQPVTKIHQEIMKMMSRHHFTNYVLLVKGKESSKDKNKNPFNVETQIRMIKYSAPSNVGIIIVPNAHIPNLIVENRLIGNKFVLYAGADRAEGYAHQIPAVRQLGKILIINKINRISDISGSEVRNDIINNEFYKFRQNTPKQIWSMYDELRNEIGENNANLL